MPDPWDMPTGHFVLLIEAEPNSTGHLAAQLVQLGIEPIRVAALKDAVKIVKAKQCVVRAVVVPSDVSGRQVRKALKSMRRVEPTLQAMVYGKPPDRTQLELLRKAGVLLALWPGYDAGVLRYQVNRLVSGEYQPSIRDSRRAPIHTPVRVWVGGRAKKGFVYSLSESGCFIESPRASMEEARLRLNFSLGERELDLAAVVAFANVPGNLQRPNLPLGMGVRFEDVSVPDRASLAWFINERLNSLEV
jgi:hypothetical protein